MADDFDPYAAWLGITTPERPPNHYQLLGLPAGESDPTKITAAAELRMASIRKLQVGPRGKLTQQLLNELSTAKICLTDGRAKAAYDAALFRPRMTPTFTAPLSPPVFSPPSEPFRLGTREATFLPAKPVKQPTSQTSAAPAPAETASESSDIGRGWLLLGLFFLLVIIGTSAGGYIAWRKQHLARIAEIEAEEAAAAALEEEVPEEAPPEELVIAQEGNGDLSFPLSAAELSEELTRTQAGGTTVISGWQSGSIARWKFRVIRPAIFKVEMQYAASQVPVAKWELTSDEEVKTRALAGAPGDDGVVRDEFFWRILASGEHVLELRAIHVSAGGTLSLHGLRMKFQQ